MAFRRDPNPLRILPGPTRAELGGARIIRAPRLTPRRVQAAQERTQTVGLLGGWTASLGKLTAGNMILDSVAERILIGAATAPLTGVGIFLGKDGSDYEFRAGDPAGAYIHWDASTLTIAGVALVPGS
ncbi:hypothetical protein LCGC14_1302080, partial [marine sediment metagenome]